MATVIKTQTASAAKKEAAKTFNLEATILEAGRTLALYMSADQNVQDAIRTRDEVKADLDALAASLHKAGVTFKGNRRTDTLGAQIYSMLPETVSEKTRNNYLSAFKRAVREGSPFNLNPSREAAKGIEPPKDAEGIEPPKDAEGIEPPKDAEGIEPKDKGKGKKRGARPPKGNKGDAPKTPLADVIKMNFITLMKNNRPRAIELLEELEELLLSSNSETDE